MAIPITDMKGMYAMVLPHDELSGCWKGMFTCFLCLPLGNATMILDSNEDGSISMGTKPMVCNGTCPMGPIPCVACCGFGPCQAKWTFHKDTTYTGPGVKFMGANKTSTFEGGCCAFGTHNNGDWFIHNDEIPTKEKPVEMTPGTNPSAPPCLIGKKVLKFHVVADRKGTPVGGAPVDAATIER